MPINKPSQYQCDNMEPGDIVFVKKRNFLYRLYRYFHKKQFKQISVRKEWNNLKPDYVQYYQEDCVLIYNYEMRCVQSLKQQVPYVISYKNIGSIKSGVLQSVEVGLYNIILQFKNISITIPTNFISDAISRNERVLKTIEDNREIEQRLKFQKYKGSTFKKIVQDRCIKQWIPSYCIVCGEPVIFEFNDDYISIKNSCNCGNITLNKTHFSYDEFALWFTSQTDKHIVKKYKQFWFDSKE